MSFRGPARRLQVALPIDSFPGEFSGRAIADLEIASAISTRCRYFRLGSAIWFEGFKAQAWVPAETRLGTCPDTELYRGHKSFLGARSIRGVGLQTNSPVPRVNRLKPPNTIS